MPPFDREGALKSAEKALKLGRIDAAIAEYVKIVEAQPRDWNSANALGDLYVRAGQVDKGIASRMLLRANELLGDAYEGVGGADPDTGERVTTLVAGSPVVKDATAEQNLRRYIGFLDAMRQISRIFGGGPLGWGDGD